MALIVETGAIVANANTYQDRAALAAMMTARGLTEWAAIASATQDVINALAAELLDASFAWRGEIVSEDQALRWPRDCVTDRDGREIASDAIPTAILKAHCELAYLMRAGALIGGANSTANAGGKIKRVKAGSVEVEYVGGAAASLAVSSSNALPNGAAELLDRILAGLFNPPGGPMIRLGKS